MICPGCGGTGGCRIVCPDCKGTGEVEILWESLVDAYERCTTVEDRMEVIRLMSLTNRGMVAVIRSWKVLL